MGYEVTFQKAWEELKQAAKEDKFIVSFLADKYEIDLETDKILSLSCNTSAPEHVGILILHFAIRKIKGLPPVRNEWISFQQLGVQGYYDAFRKRALEPLIRKFGKNPENLLVSSQRLGVKKIQYGDCAIVLEAFENVPVMITVWGADEEFSAEANILFDSSIREIFPTEDIVVLAGFVSKAV